MNVTAFLRHRIKADELEKQNHLPPKKNEKFNLFTRALSVDPLRALFVYSKERILSCRATRGLCNYFFLLKSLKRVKIL